MALSTRIEDCLASIPAVLPSPASVVASFSWCPTLLVGAIAGGLLWAPRGGCFPPSSASRPTWPTCQPYGGRLTPYVWPHIRNVTLRGSASSKGHPISQHARRCWRNLGASPHVQARVPQPGVVGLATHSLGVCPRRIHSVGHLTTPLSDSSFRGCVGYVWMMSKSREGDSGPLGSVTALLLRVSSAAGLDACRGVYQPFLAIACVKPCKLKRKSREG